MKFRWRLEHTMDQVIKKRLQQVMDASVAKGETPGCLLMVIKDGEEQVYLESGYADIEAKKPVSRDNIFRLYSMSKPITATARARNRRSGGSGQQVSAGLPEPGCMYSGWEDRKSGEGDPSGGYYEYDIRADVRRNG